jgi:hypothetical protein
MPAFIPITEDVGAREEKCGHCGEVIGVVDFIVRVSQYATIDFVHLDCDSDVKRHVEELRAAKHHGPCSHHET